MSKREHAGSDLYDLSTLDCLKEGYPEESFGHVVKIPPTGKLSFDLKNKACAGNPEAFERLFKIASGSTEDLKEALQNPNNQKRLKDWAGILSGIPMMVNEKNVFELNNEVRKFKIGYDLIPSLKARAKLKPKDSHYAALAHQLLLRIHTFKTAKRLPLELEYLLDAADYNAKFDPNYEEMIEYYLNMNSRRRKKQYCEHLKKNTPAWVYQITEIPHLVKTYFSQLKPIAKQMVKATYPKEIYCPNHKDHKNVKYLFDRLSEADRESAGVARTRVEERIIRDFKKLLPEAPSIFLNPHVEFEDHELFLRRPRSTHYAAD